MYRLVSKFNLLNCFTFTDGIKPIYILVHNTYEKTLVWFIQQKYYIINVEEKHLR